MITRNVLKLKEIEWESNIRRMATKITSKDPIHTIKTPQDQATLKSNSTKNQNKSETSDTSKTHNLKVSNKRRAAEVSSSHDSQRSSKRFKVIEEIELESNSQSNNIRNSISNSERSEKRKGHFEVDRIIGAKYNKKLKQMEYLVKWAGFKNEHNTWEPFNTLNEDVPNLIKLFHFDEKINKSTDNCIKQIQFQIKKVNQNNENKINKQNLKCKQKSEKDSQICKSIQKPFIDNIKGAEQLCKLANADIKQNANPEEQSSPSQKIVPQQIVPQQIVPQVSQEQKLEIEENKQISTSFKTLKRYSFYTLGDIKKERNRLKNEVLRVQVLCAPIYHDLTNQELLRKHKGQIIELKKLYNLISSNVSLERANEHKCENSQKKRLYFPKVNYPDISSIVKKALQPNLA